MLQDTRVFLDDCVLRKILIKIIRTFSQQTPLTEISSVATKQGEPKRVSMEENKHVI